MDPIAEQQPPQPHDCSTISNTSQKGTQRQLLVLHKQGYTQAGINVRTAPHSRCVCIVPHIAGGGPLLADAASVVEVQHIKCKVLCCVPIHLLTQRLHAHTTQSQALVRTSRASSSMLSNAPTTHQQCTMTALGAPGRQAQTATPHHNHPSVPSTVALLSIITFAITTASSVTCPAAPSPAWRRTALHSPWVSAGGALCRPAHSCIEHAGSGGERDADSQVTRAQMHPDDALHGAAVRDASRLCATGQQ